MIILMGVNYDSGFSASAKLLLLEQRKFDFLYFSIDVNIFKGLIRLLIATSLPMYYIAMNIVQ